MFISMNESTVFLGVIHKTIIALSQQTNILVLHLPGKT